MSNVKKKQSSKKIEKQFGLGSYNKEPKKEAQNNQDSGKNGDKESKK